MLDGTPAIPAFTSSDWYWRRGDEVYSSKRRLTLPNDDATFVEWRAERGHDATSWPRDADGEQTDEALSEALVGLGFGPRAMTQNQWCCLADAGGKLGAWLLACDTATRPKDRAYARTGGDSGLYQEGNSKLTRLAAAAKIDAAAMFEQAEAGQ